ncbi:MAG: DUF2723 domain-containing protein [Chloroflexi bacterium]|nr:DUF2723 domain-containing protein [Chloroflexota bacterium]
MRTRRYLIASVLGLIAFLVYRATAAPGVLFGDAGEFQFTLPLLGLSHPTGYPLYHLLGWVWEQSYRLNPAQGANHFSALWGGVAVALFYLLAQEIIGQLTTHLRWQRGSSWLAGITTLVFAANPTFWAEATRAEVYTLHAALVAGLLASTLALGQRQWFQSRARSGALPWGLALWLGLGLTHHLTIILLWPGVFLYLLWQRPDLLRPRRLLRLAPFVLVPLLLYAYVPWRGPASPWLSPTLMPGQHLSLYDGSPLGVLRFILGVGFAPALRSLGDAVAQIPQAAHLFLVHFGWPGLILILLGLLALLLEEKILALVLTVVSFVMIVGFNLFYGIGDIYTFYIPAYLIATLWLGLGLAYGIELLSRVLAGRWQTGLLALALLALLLPAWQVRSYSHVFNRSQDDSASEFWRRVLTTPDLPADAVLVSNDRDEITPLIYLQQVEGQAPGVIGIFPLMAPGPDWADLNTTLHLALQSGRPVVTVKPMPGLQALYETAALGDSLTRVLRPHPVPDTSFEQPYGDYLRWLAIAWSGDTAPGGVIDVTLTWRVVQTPPVVWHSFMQIYNEAGEKVLQADDHRPGGDFLPSSLWRPGDIMLDTFQLPLPQDLPPGGYTLVAGFYDPATGQRMADPLPVASIQSP